MPTRSSMTPWSAFCLFEFDESHIAAAIAVEPMGTETVIVCDRVIRRHGDVGQRNTIVDQLGQIQTFVVEKVVERISFPVISGCIETHVFDLVDDIVHDLEIVITKTRTDVGMNAKGIHPEFANQPFHNLGGYLGYRPFPARVDGGDDFQIGAIEHHGGAVGMETQQYHIVKADQGIDPVKLAEIASHVGTLVGAIDYHTIASMFLDWRHELVGGS